MRSSLGKFVKSAFIVVILSSCQKTPKFPTMLSSVKPRPATIETVQVEVPRAVYQEALKEQHYLRQLRIIPIVVGASEGTAIPEYRLFDVKPGGAPYLLGLRTADILVAANDFIIYEAERFKGYLYLLAGEKEANIEIRRGSNPMLFQYKFTD